MRNTSKNKKIVKEYIAEIIVLIAKVSFWELKVLGWNLINLEAMLVSKSHPKKAMAETFISSLFPFLL